MKYQRLRTTLALLIAIPLSVIIFTGCATARRVPLYDGALDLPPASGDTTYLIPLHIENHRTVDAIDPHFYLLGSGRHSLGIVRGMGGHLDAFVDKNWFGGGDCFLIVAHYPGRGDLTFDQICWRKGERLDVSLDNVFVPGAAWSHR